MNGPYPLISNESCYLGDSIQINSLGKSLCYPIGTYPNLSSPASCPNDPSDTLSQKLDPSGASWCLNSQYQQYLANLARLSDYINSQTNCEIGYHITLAMGIPFLLILLCIVIYMHFWKNYKIFN